MHGPCRARPLQRLVRSSPMRGPARSDEPRRLPLSRRRAFVQRHTRLREVDGVPGVRLHLADAVEPVWHAVEEALGIDGAPIPFWAFAWAGGLALARWLQEHPDEAARTAACSTSRPGAGSSPSSPRRRGAAHVAAVDIDPFAEAAVGAQRAREPRPRDVCDPRPARRAAARRRRAARRRHLVRGPARGAGAAVAPGGRGGGTRVVVGDPGRKYLPPAVSGLVELAAWPVHTTTTLEDREMVTARVFALPPR